MLIFAIDDEIFIHARNIILDGKIQVLDYKGEEVKSFTMSQLDYCSFRLDAPTGKYLVRVSNHSDKVERYVFIKTPRSTGGNGYE